jgi:hypothetical protein
MLVTNGAKIITLRSGASSLASGMQEKTDMSEPGIKVREALRFIDERRRSDPQSSLPLVVDSAMRKFDLTLSEQSQVWRTLRGSQR